MSTLSLAENPSESFFLTIRVIHILMASLWLGSGAFITFFLFPVARQLGPNSSQFLLKLSHRRFHLFMPLIAITTVLTGLWLYWRFTYGFNSGATHSGPGITFGLGGLSGITALIIGASVIGRSAKRMVLLLERASGLPESPERAGYLQTVATLQARMAAGSKVVLVLITTALVLMTLGHYA